jgi:hypothetical protein
MWNLTTSHNSEGMILWFITCDKTGSTPVYLVCPELFREGVKDSTECLHEDVRECTPAGVLIFLVIGLMVVLIMAGRLRIETA